EGISVYAGSGDCNKVSALVIAADILAKELDVKILAGCNEDEEDAVLRFLNQTDYQKTVLIHRGNELPSWGFTDN
ncbi:MAG: Inorganic pyrophosphatase, partial [Erysipelotrichaceae bacterium]|nr:Inorganic pyrophosphatase [Erysipelotrichaceae bacterium]